MNVVLQRIGQLNLGFSEQAESIDGAVVSHHRQLLAGVIETLGISFEITERTGTVRFTSHRNHAVLCLSRNEFGNETNHTSLETLLEVLTSKANGSCEEHFFCLFDVDDFFFSKNYHTDAF